MKNIIKAFIRYLSYNTELDYTNHSIEKILTDFDTLYEDFIECNPIGKAEQSIIGEIWNRASIGVKKYGCTTDRIDLTQEQWKQHLREELMDSLVYLTKIEDGKSI